jgi:hypothetical protein
MIRKSGYRIFESIMSNQRSAPDHMKSRDFAL